MPEMRLERFGDWDVAVSLLEKLADPVLNSQVLSSMVLEGGKFLVKELQGAIDSGLPGWPQLSRMTIEMKGHAKPLFGAQGSDIKDGIKLIHQRENASVGIQEGDRTPEGDDLSVIAAVQEFGAIIPVTEKMRGWFARQGFPLSPDTQVIVIPRRALFQPVLEKTRDALQQNMTDAGWDEIERYFAGATTMEKMG